MNQTWWFYCWASIISRSQPFGFLLLKMNFLCYEIQASIVRNVTVAKEIQDTYRIFEHFQLLLLCCCVSCNSVYNRYYEKLLQIFHLLRALQTVLHLFCAIIVISIIMLERFFIFSRCRFKPFSRGNLHQLQP